MTVFKYFVLFSRLCLVWFIL